MVYLIRFTCLLTLLVAQGVSCFGHDASSRRLKKSALTSKASNLGDPLVITWSIVPDGTSMPNNNVASGTKLKSDFIGSMDKVYGKGDLENNKDLTKRPWFKLLSDVFKEYESKTGLTYVFEPNDDGKKFNFTASLGVKSVRGDLRIGGLSMGEQNNVRAYSGYPDGSGFSPSIVFNTAHFLFKNPANIDFLLSHENMHSAGMAHVLVNKDPRLTAAASMGGGTGQGPQFDDLLGLHMRYGDALEKNGGNDSLQKATNLGVVTKKKPLRIGFDAGELVVKSEQIDFVSIDNKTDVDVYRFQVEESMPVVIRLTPRGPTYEYIMEDQGQRSKKINASKLNDLSFVLSNSNGRKIEVNETGKGEVEFFNTNPAPGVYYVQVRGLDRDPQFYSLEVAAEKG